MLLFTLLSIEIFVAASGSSPSSYIRGLIRKTNRGVPNKQVVDKTTTTATRVGNCEKRFDRVMSLFRALTPECGAVFVYNLCANIPLYMYVKKLATIADYEKRTQWSVISAVGRAIIIAFDIDENLTLILPY